MVPDQIQKFIDAFSRLPAFGPRLATRLAFYLKTLDAETFKNLEASFSGLKNINRCGRCFFLKDVKKNLCDICQNPQRDKFLIAIVEKETDILSLEKTGHFKGQYLLLGELAETGALGTSERLRVEALKTRITKELNGKAKELIFALNPSTFGDFTANLLKEELKNLSEKTTRLGRGIPTGGEIEFADEETLGSALDRRN